MSYDPTENTIEGWMSTCELTWLYDKACQYDTIVEIGSWKGRSAHALGNGCKVELLCVDHFLGNVEERHFVHLEATQRDIFVDFMSNVGHLPKIKVYKGSSLDAASLCADKIVDMVFIDGSHTYENAKADIVAWMPKCKHFLCGHDYQQSSIPRIAEELGLTIKEVGIGSLWYVEVPE